MKNSVQHFDERKKILLVEDNNTTRQIYKSRLFMEGFSVIEAKNGMDALKFINEEAPDLIILDLYMDEMDGFKVISILRASPQWKKLPVIAISSRGTKDVIEKVINTGANIFLSKMVTTPSKLAETAEAVLQQEG
jgi:CheY-like chemotaxis protein